MSLIKCEECGKEISDKAGSCPNCGCPINSTETDSEYYFESDGERRKYWSELIPEEKTRIVNYRKSINNWWNIDRIIMLCTALIGIVLELISIAKGSNERVYAIVGAFFIFISLVSFWVSSEEQKKWYEENKEVLYSNKVLE